MFNLSDAQQQAFNYLVSQAAHIEAKVYEKKYPEFMYPQLVPVDSSADPWAPAIIFTSSDQVGQAEFYNHRADDMPNADITREAFASGVHMAGIGYDYTIQEVMQAQKFGIPLTTNKANAARRAAQQFIEDTVIVGQASKNWTGLVNDPDITRVDALDDGTGGDAPTRRLWSSKTADQITRDVNDALNDIYSDSNTVEMADTILLPTAAWTTMGTTRLSGTDSTAWKFFLENNVYKMQTGQQPVIRGVRYLNFAGEDGVGRMVVYKREEDIVKLHLPMPHQFMGIWQRGPIKFANPGIFRLAGLEIKRTGAFRYVDGVTAAAA